jgi:hypothetical protein
MTPATVMMTRRITRTIAVAGRTPETMASGDEFVESASGDTSMARSGVSSPRTWMRPPQSGGLINMKEGAVTVGRAGRLSVHTLDERAHGMRGTASPSSCMLGEYRSLCVGT